MNQIQNKKMGVGVGVMILKNGQILLGRRNPNPNKASSSLHGEGTWTMPGGKLHFGEDLKEAAEREVLEETSLLVKNLEIISITNDIKENAHFVTIGFLATEFEREPKAMEPEEITEWKFFKIDKLPKPLFSPSAKIVRNYLTKKIYNE